ncbi:MAG: bifunctional 4-hydroxy-2-oxoglutarate aldolase/2-dehydro-3-deoxy-phosphogluconate aldolase [Oscillospiraceae bacterium]|nr:bifunctional 4-hydroxy-2-oxoglutarate aldolase/2-dehydro-3-deoxy-phosphogluconate aldolase [Oscillospiraceae bacterium]
MEDIISKLSNAGVVPVVVIENAADAVPTARALLAGGIGVMEITFRTAAAPEAIRSVARECPEMTVGAGTVVTLEQCRQAVEMGAKFIVAPGYDGEVVGWCIDQGIPVTPGCVTPTEITAALRRGLKVLKFFPANVYGGLNAMKALAGPFGGVKFIPTGGVDARNCGEYSAAPFVHAVGGSWICTKADIAAHNFEKITALCREARQAVLGFEVAHIGINCAGAEASREVCRALSDAFGFAAKEGNSSIFSTPAIEVMKSDYLGERGHIAIRTNKISMAAAVLEESGYALDMETAKYKDGRMTAVYLRKEFGGFAVHLLQK